MPKQAFDVTLGGKETWRVSLDPDYPTPAARETAIREEISAGRAQMVTPQDTAPSLYRQIARYPTEGLDLALRAGGLIPPNPISRTAAEMIVPQTEGELAMGAITGAGGAVSAGIRGFKGALMRVLSGMTGGAAMGAIDPERDMTTSALLGLVGGLAGESVGFLADRLKKSGSTRVATIISDADATHIGGDILTGQTGKFPELRRVHVDPSGQVTFGESVFGRPETPEALRDLVLGGERTAGRTILTREYGRLMDAIEGRIQQVTNRPTLFTDPLDPNRHIAFWEAKRGLSELYDIAYKGKKGDPLTTSIKGLAPKEAYDAAKATMRHELADYDPTTVPIFDAAQAQFRVGIGLMQALKNAFTGRKLQGRTYMDTEHLRTTLTHKQARLEKQLGIENYDELMRGINRGAPIGVGGEDVMSGPGVAMSGAPLESPRLSLFGLQRFLQGPSLIGEQPRKLQFGGLPRTGLTLGTQRGLLPLTPTQTSEP